MRTERDTERLRMHKESLRRQWDSSIFMIGGLTLATRLIRINDLPSVIDIASRMTEIAPENVWGQWISSNVANLVPHDCPTHGLRPNWVSESRPRIPTSTELGLISSCGPTLEELGIISSCEPPFQILKESKFEPMYWSCDIGRDLSQYPEPGCEYEYRVDHSEFRDALINFSSAELSGN